MDILGGMSSGGGESPYLKWKTGDMKFYNGENPIEFQYLQLDPSTFLSGWGAYNKATGYDFVWDEQFGVAKTKPSEEYKRAFSAWVLPQGLSRPLLWQNFTYAESQAFNKILSLFWNDRDKNGDLLPVVKFTGAKKLQVGLGQSSELSFEFAKFAPKSNEFVVPNWYYEDSKEDNVDNFVSPNEGLSDLVNKQINDNNDLLTDEDIPF
jgi:hypothetical protein|tara:strand:- start:260 stop:883 length:624 start_codon:yes stop_codon:yes gene_type:complete